MKVLINGKEIETDRCDIIYEDYDNEGVGNDLHLKHTNEGVIMDIHNGDECKALGYRFVEDLVEE